MSYVQWRTVWHVVLPGEQYTLCGRWVESSAHCREVPPLEMYLCQVCAGAS